MSSPATPSSLNLKQHFAQRVVYQARLLLEIWQRAPRSLWTEATLDELEDATLRLLRLAQRLEQPEHARLARQLCELLEAVRGDHGYLTASSLQDLEALMLELAHSSLRHSDQLAKTALPAPRRPVYLLLGDLARAEHLAGQLAFFGLNAVALPTPAALLASLREQPGLAMLMDVDFAGRGQGLSLALQVQHDLVRPLPVVFFSAQPADTQVRIAAVKAGAEGFITGGLDAPTVLEKIEQATALESELPFKALVIDDSRAQAAYTAKILNNAGIIARSLCDPERTLDELSDFQPDVILLDLYMPGCNGPQLAKAIRQHERFVSVPIIYLSAEDDTDKQLDAMSEGGDDFLTKPVRSRHLITCVRTRASRARELNARMIRDSLTSLYNHTHILQLLEDCSLRARRERLPLSFAMLDIDHFKAINDQHGHPVGDRVIKSLSLFLRQRLRKTDFIGRYGGEEFAIVMPDTDLEAAFEVLEEIRLRFADVRYSTRHQELACTFSVGLVQLSAQGDCTCLTARADQALYVAKHNGRNQIVCLPAP